MTVSVQPKLLSGKDCKLAVGIESRVVRSTLVSLDRLASYPGSSTVEEPGY